MLTMKWKLERTTQDTIIVRVFLGEEGQTLQNAGCLALRVGEYQLTAAALSMGAKQTNGQLRFEVEGEAAALETNP